jgi:hypothetical protein
VIRGKGEVLAVGAGTGQSTPSRGFTCCTSTKVQILTGSWVPVDCLSCLILFGIE